jgi:hypothetical protein
MTSITSNRWLRTASVARITGVHGTPGALSRASLCYATDLDVQHLWAAKRRCEHQVRKGRVSIAVGLTLGAAALVAACCVSEPFYRPMLLIAAAAEIGFVPWCTSLASRRLHGVMALIELDLEEGLVEPRNGQVRTVFGVWPVLEDSTTRSLRLIATGRAAFAGLRPGAIITYRFGARSGLVLAITPQGVTNNRLSSRQTDDRNITRQKNKQTRRSRS